MYPFSIMITLLAVCTTIIYTKYLHCHLLAYVPPNTCSIKPTSDLSLGSREGVHLRSDIAHRSTLKVMGQNPHAMICKVPKNCRYRLVECHPGVSPNCAEVTLPETNKFAVCQIYGRNQRKEQVTDKLAKWNTLHIQNEHWSEVKSQKCACFFLGGGEGCMGKEETP